MSSRLATQSSSTPITFQHDVKISARNENTFPWRLHIVLDAAEREGFTDIVSWIDESSFKVHVPDAFVDEIMPRFFQQTKYKSFQRQCNLWGFDRLPNGPQKSGYTRKEYFVRGHPALVAKIQRMKIKGHLSKRLCRKNGGIPQSTKENSSIAKIANAVMRKVTGDKMVPSNFLEDLLVPQSSIPKSIDLSIGCHNLQAEHFNHTKIVGLATYNEDEVDDLPMNFDDLDVLGIDFCEEGNIDVEAGGIEDAMLGTDEPVDLCTADYSCPLLEHSFKEDQRPTPIGNLDSNVCGTRKSSLIDYLVAKRRSHQSCRISTASTTATLSCSSSSASVSSSTSWSTQVSQKPLSAICAVLRDPCPRVSPTTTVQSFLEHQMVPKDFLPPISSSYQPMPREPSPASPMNHADTNAPSRLSSKSYFLSYSSRIL